MAKKIEAFHSGELFEIGQGYVVVGRHRSENDIEAGVFLLDVYCTGVKDAFYTRTSLEEYGEMLERLASEETRVSLSPADSRKLVEDAIAYARHLGFAPHRDHKKASRVLGGIKATDSTMEFSFGQKGKPYYVQGQYDSPEKAERILRQLETRCGTDGFHYLLVTDPDSDDFLPYDEEDDDIEAAIDPDILKSEWAALDGSLNPGNLERTIIAAIQSMNEGATDQPNEALDQVLEMSPEEIASLGQRWRAGSPIRGAKILAFEAYEADNPEKARETALRALEVSDTCVEAWTALGLTDGNLSDASRHFEKAVSLSEKLLRDDSPYGDSDAFGSQLALREYLRAKLNLGRIHQIRAIRDPDQETKALKHLTEVIDIIPNDPFRVRDWLVPLHLAMHRDGDAERLLTEYEHESTQDYWACNRALLLYRKGNRKQEAEETLRQAFSINPTLPDVLFDSELEFENEPTSALQRSIQYKVNAYHAWTATEGALDWLREIAESRSH